MELKRNPVLSHSAILEMEICYCCHANNATQLNHGAVAMQISHNLITLSCFQANNDTWLNDAAVTIQMPHSFKSCSCCHASDVTQLKHATVTNLIM